jgi:hypothetical protein
MTRWRPSSGGTATYTFRVPDMGIVNGPIDRRGACATASSEGGAAAMGSCSAALAGPNDDVDGGAPRPQATVSPASTPARTQCTPKSPERVGVTLRHTRKVAKRSSGW